MEPEKRRCLPTKTDLAAKGADVELRVNVGSKKELSEQLNKYKNILETVFDGQKDVEEETKRVLLQELLANFEAGVQDNVLVDGQPWEEAADDEESTDLDVLLDDAIVEAAWKRRVYPKRILEHVVHSLRAERKLMGLYENAVSPEEVLRDPDQENVMSDAAAAAPPMVKEAVQVMKSIQSVQRQAEGLCHILNTKPSPTALEIHREVLGHNGQSDAHLLPEGGTHRSRQPIRRAVEEAAAAARLTSAPVHSRVVKTVLGAAPTPLMSHWDALGSRRTCEGTKDSHGRREKNRAAAQKSRRKQTERADFLHETCELLEWRNRQLSREVSSLCEEIRLLTHALRTHEPFCPIVHCSDGHTL